MEQSNEPTVGSMNEVMALFDGWKLIKGNPELICASCDEGKIPSGWCTCDQKNDRFQKGNKIVSLTYFRYHASWENLMPVWNALRLKVEEKYEHDYPAEYSAFADMWNVWCFTVNIEFAHKEVHKAIQWYNQLNKCPKCNRMVKEGWACHECSTKV